MCLCTMLIIVWKYVVMVKLDTKISSWRKQCEMKTDKFKPTVKISVQFLVYVYMNRNTWFNFFRVVC